MPHYEAPLPEFRFLLQEVFDYEARVAALPGLADATMDLVLPVLSFAGDFARDVLLPLNLPGDREGCRQDAKGVHTPRGYREAYTAYVAGGWPSLAADPAYGGQGLPLSLAMFVRELVAAGSMAFGMYGGLSQGAYRALAAHGSEALRQQILPRLVSGEWTGTMCLTEPESGSDLSRLRTRAVPAGDGSYRVSGSKIFISGGDHDLAANIVHLVLARLPDAPPGTRGLSLFIVPKCLSADGREPGDARPNGVACTAIEHKMGIRGSATAALAFDDASGWLVGGPHGGLRAMLTMMNSSRLGVAVQSLGVAEIAWQNARAYALGRRQGRAPVPEGGAPQGDPIALHPDLRRQLLTMKALVEGMRAMLADAAMALDERARQADAAAREAAELRLAVLTPVLKSFVSDAAVQVADLGITVHGGHGYIHENGAEQWLRDARIVPLYEGSNAIQALDLVQRKLGLAEGRAVESVFEDVEQVIAASHGEVELAGFAAPLADALALLRRVTTRLRAADTTTAAAAASAYLSLFGWVLLGTAWLRMALAAHRGGGNEAPAFYRGKRKTARYVFEGLLPAETSCLAASLDAQADIVVGVALEEL